MLCIRCGLRTSPTSRCRKTFSTWLRSWTCTPVKCSAGSSITGSTRNSAWRLWRLRWKVDAPESPTPTRAISSPHPSSLPICRLRQFKSAGLERSIATTTSTLDGCGEHKNKRGCICLATAMAGRKQYSPLPVEVLQWKNPHFPGKHTPPKRAIIKPNPDP